MRTMMLLIHLLLSSVSVECTTCDSFLRLFRNYVYYHFIFPKINKRGAGIKEGRGWKIFQKLISGEGRLFGTREYMLVEDKQQLWTCYWSGNTNFSSKKYVWQDFM